MNLGALTDVDGHQVLSMAESEAGLYAGLSRLSLQRTEFNFDAGHSYQAHRLRSLSSRGLPVQALSLEVAPHRKSGVAGQPPVWEPTGALHYICIHAPREVLCRNSSGGAEQGRVRRR